MVQKFRKKPVEIEAEQFVIWDLKNAPSFVELHGVRFPVWEDYNQVHYIIIPTKEGNMKASNLDWIIKGVQGEIYPCKPDIFVQTYEPINV